MRSHLFRRVRPLPDLAPSQNDDVLRWPNGDIWIPESTPTQRSGVFGFMTQADWRHHAMAAAAQVRALTKSHDKRAGQGFATPLGIEEDRR